MTATADPSIRAEFARVDGYWTERRLKIWAGLTIEQREHDRLQGWFPPGQGAYETADGRLEAERIRQDAYDDEHACQCHIRPPCWHCTDCRDCAANQ